MNLDTKIVVKADKKQPIEFTRRFYIKLIFDSVYFQETKHDNDEIVQINSSRFGDYKPKPIR